MTGLREWAEGTALAQPVAGSMSAAAETASATPAEVMPPQGREFLLGLVEGYRGSALLYVAAKLGIADLLADGPRSCDDLARVVGCHPDALRRVLRGLVVMEVLTEQPDGALALSPMGAWLRRDHPLSVYPRAILAGEEFMAAWGALLHSAQTGETAFPHVFGMGVWEHRAQHPELNACFNQYMVQQTAPTNQALLAAYDFSAFRTVCDVAGGQGALLVGVLQRCPGARGLLFDQPHVVTDAHGYLEAAGVAGRCTLVSGDFFAPYPDSLRGLDAYVLKNIIHDWEDEPSLAILRRCREAMGASSRLLLVERLLPSRAAEDPVTIWMDLQMLACAGGRQRTEAEYRTLLAAAGLMLTRIVPTTSGFSVVEALPATAG